MNLCLFFSYNISLKAWVDTGLIDREKMIYEKYVENGIFERVYWLTYGSADQALSEELKRQGKLHDKIMILSVPKWLDHKAGRFFYSFVAPLIHRRILGECSILKTNQIEGGWTAVVAKKITGKKLFVRCGYVWSLFIRLQKRKRQLDWLNPWLEPLIFQNADGVSVSSRQARDYLRNQYYLPEGKLTIIPNYIDTRRFEPSGSQVVIANRLIFVGRLHEQKNLRNVIEAVSRCGVGLDIYGEGELRGALIDWSRQQGADVEFKGVVKNCDLPGLLNRYRYFILASNYEGMPKSLLEAMACGLVSLATDVEGNREVIKDGVNGYLIPDVSAGAIERTIRRVMAEDSTDVQKSARQTILETYSLESVFLRERAWVAHLIEPDKYVPR